MLLIIYPRVDRASLRGRPGASPDMPLYELFVISRSASVFSKSTSELQEVMKRTATQILDTPALVRKLEFLGHRRLPYRMKSQEKYVYEGNYWQIQFFGPTNALDQLRFHLKFDPEVIRFTILKRGDSLKDFVQP